MFLAEQSGEAWSCVGKGKMKLSLIGACLWAILTFQLSSDLMKSRSCPMKRRGFSTISLWELSNLLEIMMDYDGT